MTVVYSVGRRQFRESAQEGETFRFRTAEVSEQGSERGEGHGPRVARAMYGRAGRYPALYNDFEVLQKNAWFKSVLDILTNAVARPSTVTGADYSQVSTALFQNVNKVLSGDESTKAQSLKLNEWQRTSCLKRLDAETQ